MKKKTTKRGLGLLPTEDGATLCVVDEAGNFIPRFHFPRHRLDDAASKLEWKARKSKAGQVGARESGVLRCEHLGTYAPTTISVVPLGGGRLTLGAEAFFLVLEEGEVGTLIREFDQVDKLLAKYAA